MDLISNWILVSRFVSSSLFFFINFVFFFQPTSISDYKITYPPQVGGPEESYNAAKTLFLSMGKSSVYCGGAGNGSVSFISSFVISL